MPDLPVLDAIEQRVLGALLEKQRTVPDTYPPSLNALRTACNQATSRDPVVDYDEQTVIEALGRLRERELVRFVKPTGLRVVKYHQRLEEHLGLDEGQAALIAVLLLRGAQTAGELRTRTERMYAFPDREATEDALHEMAAADVPLVASLERQAGQHDRRWTHLLGGESAEPVGLGPAVDREQVLAAGPSVRDRVVAAEYDRLAEAYAAAVDGELERLPFDRWLLDRLAAQTAGGQGLDVGCGPGQVAAYLAGRDVAMTGLDNSASMVEWAQALHPAVQVVRGNFVVPPMPRGADPRDPGWGLVSAWYAFVHLAESELAPTFAALNRVLRRGGWLAVATYVGQEVQHPGELFGEPTDLDFVLHSADAVISAAEGAGMTNIEWYLRGPVAGEVPNQRFYLLARRPE